MSFPLMPVMNMSSDPGASWEQAASIPGQALKQLSVSPTGVWIAAGSSLGRVYRSTNYGATWAASSTAGVGGMRASAYGNGLFVVAEDADDRISTSSDGLTWTTRFTGSVEHYNAKYNDGYFVIGAYTASGGGITASANGTSWSLNPQGVMGPLACRCGIYVASLGRTFAAGASGQAKYVNAIPTSATPWTGTLTTAPSVSLDVAWSPTRSIAVLVGSGIYSSTDLITWTQRATDTFEGVSWCGNQFVAVGSFNRISTSPDGVTWTARTAPPATTGTLYGVAEYGGVILVTSTNGTVLKSS